MKIAIAFKNMERDLLPFLLLRRHLAGLGHDARIFYLYEYYPIWRFNPEALVVSNLISKRDSQLAHRAKSEGRLIFLARCEAVLDEFLSDVLTKRNPDHIQDLDFIWGPQQRPISLKLGVPEEKLRVCGNPRFDKYRLRIADKAAMLRRLGRERYTKVVGYATWAFGVFAQPRGIMQDALRASGQAADIPRVLALRQRLLAAFNRLVAAHPDVLFLVKLRTEQQVDEAAQLEVDVNCRADNLVFVKNENDAAELTRIEEVISASDVWMHLGSNTSVEAGLLDKPVITLAFDPGLKYIFKEFGGTDVARDEDELEARLSHYLDGGAIPAAQLAQRREFNAWHYFRTDGRASARIAAAIDDFCRRQPPTVRRRLPSLLTAGDAVLSAGQALTGVNRFRLLRRFFKVFRNLPYAPARLRAEEAYLERIWDPELAMVAGKDDGLD